VYGFVQGLTHPSSPLRGADRIVSIFRQGHFRELGPLSGNEYLLLKNHLDAFDWIGAARITPSDIDDRGTRTEIIGVVGSQVFETYQQHTEPTIYFPMWQERPPRMTLILKGSNWNGRLLADLRRRIESVPGHDLASPVIKTLDTQLAQSAFAPLRITTLIGGASASSGLILSILGLFCAQDDAERQRLRELALRLALGAQRWRIVFKVLKNAGRLALLGTVIGSLVSLAFLRLLIADAVSITAPPFWVWMIAPLLPAIAVMTASVIPARRASNVDPLTIMRDNNRLLLLAESLTRFCFFQSARSPYVHEMPRNVKVLAGIGHPSVRAVQWLRITPNNSHHSQQFDENPIWALRPVVEDGNGTTAYCAPGFCTQE
jgi:FtsX-like permease family